MTSAAPIECVWNGEVFRPISPYWVRRADKQFTIGEVVRLVDHPERSMRMHNFYFASVENAWRNLPERFPTSTHLRKWALIKAGFNNSVTMPCGSALEARRLAAFIRPMDEMSVVDVKGSVITLFTAKSQSVKAMGPDDFKKSKEAVLEIVAEMIGVKSGELTAQGAEV